MGNGVFGIEFSRAFRDKSSRSRYNCYLSLSLSLVSLADRPRLALYCSFVVNGTRCGRALKREGEIKRWQKEWDGRGDREMKRRGIGEKRAKNDRIAAEFPRNSGFRAGMAVARWNIMLSHRLILSSRWKRDRWNSRMSLFPPSSKKGWLIRNIRISSYDVLHSALFVSFSFFFLFCFFFLKGERERERAFLVESSSNRIIPRIVHWWINVAGSKMQQKSLKTCYMGMAITVWKGSSRWWPMVYDGGTNSYRIWILNCCTCKAGKLCIWTQKWLVVIYYRLF